MHCVKTTLLRSTGHIWVSKTSLFLFKLKNLIMQLLETLTKLAMQTGEGLVGGIYKELGNFKLRANGCNNSYQTMLRTVASVLVVVCKRMQQLPTMLAHHGCWSVTRSYCFAVSKETMCNARVWPQQCWESCAILLRHASAITELKKYWELRNNMQQGMQTDATCNNQQCCVRLSGALRLVLWFSILSVKWVKELSFG